MTSLSTRRRFFAAAPAILAAGATASGDPDDAPELARLVRRAQTTARKARTTLARHLRDDDPAATAAACDAAHAAADARLALLGHVRAMGPAVVWDGKLLIEGADGEGDPAVMVIPLGQVIRA